MHKTITFLSNPVFSELKSDPTARFQTELKNILKNSNIVQPNTIHKFVNPKPQSPILRVTTKIHKHNLPIRPIVNYKPAPSYKIKKTP